MKRSGLAAPLVAIYVFADVGPLGGGWLSSAPLKRGWTVNRAHKPAFFVAALAIVLTMFAPSAKSKWTAVAIANVAAAAQQWWSATLFTAVSVMFPRRTVT